jgi:hypothetical protein
VRSSRGGWRWRETACGSRSSGWSCAIRTTGCGTAPGPVARIGEGAESLHAVVQVSQSFFVLVAPSALREGCDDRASREGAVCTNRARFFTRPRITVAE